MPGKRWDETWHRLKDWTNGQGPSERLAAQILLAEGYRDLDPSHPLGGPDGARDAVTIKDGNRWVMAVHFPRRPPTLAKLTEKLQDDYKGVSTNHAHGLVFVCNQELTVAERDTLMASVTGPVELYHLERITAVLDQPRMGPVRRQFALEDDSAHRLEALQTGGDTYAYIMLFNFDMAANIARDFALIRRGEYPLYDLRFRILDMDENVDVLSEEVGELNSAAKTGNVKWPLKDTVYYRMFFFARNGFWHQDLQLRRSETAECWLAATRVTGLQHSPDFQEVPPEFVAEFGEPVWRS